MVVAPGLIAPLVLFAVVLVCTPGANNVVAATSGAQYGVRASLRLVVGLGLGVVVLVVAAAAGLGLLISSVPAGPLVMRIAATGYVVWLAWRIAKSAPPDLTFTAPTVPRFGPGFIISAVNPKVWMLALSATAEFSALAADPLGLSLVLGVVFAAVVFPNLLMWCYLGRAAASQIRSRRGWSILYAVMAGLLLVSIAPMWLE